MIPWKLRHGFVKHSQNGDGLYTINLKLSLTKLQRAMEKIVDDMRSRIMIEA
ncbi:hypothetical protein QJS10_CPA02g01024 [Acorus calamus]|uniref:Uncharacterized protein n=1 Tax=Acorus calamus TaxID=4465 RepID=A0AAV9FGK8_ACOCL|nr:hypothetical protein QJS10_CPA02g01024 [Acorus calamus]